MNVKYFCIHSPKHQDRNSYLTKTFEELNLEVNFVFQDKHELTQQLIDEYYKFDLTETNRRLDIILNTLNHNPYTKHLNSMEIAVSIDHFKLYEMLSKEDDDTIFVIFEDDVIFNNSEFKNNLEKLINEASLIYKNDPWVLYFGKGLSSSMHYSSEDYEDVSHSLYFKKNYLSHYSDSYALNKKSALKILERSKPFYFAVDWELSYACNNNIYTLYSKDTLTCQGSGTNYSSTNK